jgi:uncharacterized protein
VVAGIAGTAGGVSSLVSYPALLLAGLPPLAANVTNSLALVTLWPGSALGSRTELRGRGRWLLRMLPPMAITATAGAVLLLVTPPRTFTRIVPLLILVAVAALLLEPLISARRAADETRGPSHRLALPAALAAIGVYAGYFGAGAGVMVLAAMLLLVERDLPTANALKNMLTGAATLPSAFVFAFFGPVHWGAAVPLGVGIFVGARIGPEVVRRVPPARLRAVIAVLGIAMAIELAL